MKLELDKKLSNEETYELKKRIYTALEQIFMEGVSVGRETEDLTYEAEEFAKHKIAEITEFFIDDTLWETRPPQDYLNIERIPEYEGDGPNECNDAVEEFEGSEKVEKPEWADKERPFN